MNYTIRGGSNIRFFKLHFKYIRGMKYFSVKMEISKRKNHKNRRFKKKCGVYNIRSEFNIKINLFTF